MLLPFMQMVNSQPYVILDTETTGLEDGEIVQIAIISSDRQPLLETLVKPVNPIPDGARRIHGISDEMVASAPSWRAIRDQVISIITGQNVVIYNAIYDRKMMHRSDEYAQLPRMDYKQFATFHCAMLAYAEFWGDWNSYFRSYRWQKLSDAARQQHIQVIDAHTALGDCLMTWEVIERMKVQHAANS
ncbi:MAG: 3'-5' exonuclease [Anaerolineae bacterium]|nr:3'-5' exonuclease [Anaerolineae bacterium]